MEVEFGGKGEGESEMEGESVKTAICCFNTSSGLIRDWQ